DVKALGILKSVLEDPYQEPMVRHEAAEALGAIGSEAALPYLRKYKKDQILEVAETCELAINRITWLKYSSQGRSKLSKSVYTSVDPAPAALIEDINELKSLLIDEKVSLFGRYGAMFALRDIGTQEAVIALGTALKCGSALFKHEVAYVLGQMQHKDSVPYLIESLEDKDENEMVRHECA
nr:nero [Cucujiformia]